MDAKGYTQADLVRRSHLSKTTISRILRDDNDKGRTYQPKESVVVTLSLALELGIEEASTLYFTAFPERIFWPIFIDKKFSVSEANEVLYEYGLPLLDNAKEE